MSKLFNKWFSGKKRECEEHCCVEKRRGINQLDNHLENPNHEGGRKKSDHVDGKGCSKVLTATCPPTKCSESESVTDHDMDEIGAYGPQKQSEVEFMPVSKTDTHYNMNHPYRGKALIFNFDTWDNTSVHSLSLQPRLGSKKDAKDLTKCLKELDFEVVPYDNLKSEEFWKVIKEVRSEDHRQNDCIVIAILTHGEKNHIYLKCGTLIPVNLVWEAFEAHKAPTLAAKPKIFFIQACRGDKFDHGTILSSSQEQLTPTSMYDTTDSASFSYTIPNSADIFVAFSCPFGHYSWRHPQNGSWFIQSICTVFSQYGYEKDLNELLTIVAREVALNNESSHDDPAKNKKKQVTSTSSTLIRIVKFNPKVKSLHIVPQYDHAVGGQYSNNNIQLRPPRQMIPTEATVSVFAEIISNGENA